MDASVPPSTSDQNSSLVFVEDCCDDDGACYRILSSSEEAAASVGLPFAHVAQPALVVYRSVGIGAFGAVMRWMGMPLEKIALFMNSSQVTGSNQLRQAVQLTFREGLLAPYRVVGPASITAWFMQYSVMGVAFQFFDQALSNLFQVRPMYYGKELMEPAPPPSHTPLLYQAKEGVKTILSPVLAACLESFVSNRAEAQRYFGPQKFAAVEQRLAAAASSSGTASWTSLVRRAAGPAFMANAGRNVIMCQTSFILTPITYKLYFPQEQKSKSTLFWYGLGLNIFVGNVAAITQQALWGRSLDYLNAHGQIHYRSVIQQGLAKEGGIRAFFTVPKWFSRVLMNAPAQGTLPWFYNEILPLGEHFFLKSFKTIVYDNYQTAQGETVVGGDKLVVPTVLAENLPEGAGGKVLLGRPCNIQRTRTHYGTLPTANPEFLEARHGRR
jgi:hypothetical protein